jgi:hypothetical protein
MNFDMSQFVETLTKVGSFSARQKHDLIKAARAACGECIETIKHGDVYKSTRGVRLVVQVGCDRFSLVSLKSFDPQYDEKVGDTVGRRDMDLLSLEAYMYSRKYVRVGRIEDFLRDILKE